MTVIEQLSAFITSCPLLKPFGDGQAPKIYVDYTGENATGYTLAIVPSEPYYKKYVDGGGIRQIKFLFRSVETFDGRDIATNTGNIAFYERFANWLETARPLPDGWVRVEPLTNGYVFDMPEAANKAAYQIQCRVQYMTRN